MKQHLLFKALIGSVSATAMMASPAYAQIEEIIVTAEKRSESVQDVSASINAFTSDGLSAGGINDVSRLDLLVPGVNFAFIGNDAKFNVRGANSNNTFNDASSIVGVFVDGVYKPRASQQTSAFYDVERLEFLKGPQGTLYGRNTLAGALNLYSNKPDFDEASGGINLSAESFNTRRAEGFANIPVNEDVAVRVAGFFESTDGYVDNIAGPRLGATDEYGLRLSVLYEPTDNVSFLLRASRARETGTSLGVFSFAGLCRPVNAAGFTDQTGEILDCENPRRGSLGGTPFDQLDPLTVEQDFVADGDVNEDAISLEANIDFGPVTLKSISSYTDFTNFIGTDGDSSAAPFERFWNDERNESITQEFQLSSNYDSPLQWVGGAYYSNDDQRFSFLTFRQTIDANNNPNGATALVSLDTQLNGFFADLNLLDVDTFGVFGQAEYSFTDRLRVILGARYNLEEKSLIAGSNFSAPELVFVQPGLDFNPFAIPTDPFQVFGFNTNGTPFADINESFDRITWKVAGEFDLNDDTLLYGSVATGFLSGQLNGNNTITDQQTSINYELGVKAQLLDNTLQLNGAVFYTDYVNLLTQVQEIVPATGNPVTFGANGGDIEALGLELDVVYAPTPELTLTAGLSLLDAEYVGFSTANLLQQVDGEDALNIDLSGETPPWSPDVTVTLGANYVYDIGTWGSLTPAVQFFYSASYQASVVLPFTDVARQDSFTKTDLSVTWTSPNGAYSVQGFVENVEDEIVNARANVGGNDFVQTAFLPPRNWGLRLKTRF